MENKTIVIISDIHSRKNKLIPLLQSIGAMNENEERNQGFQLVQVGDAVSAGYGMKESSFYQWWTALLEEDDVELVGNHEAPVLWEHDDRFNFMGYDRKMGKAGCDPDLKPLVLARKSRYKMAHVVEDWLITHAGVEIKYQRDDAHQTAEYLNDLWDRHMAAYYPHPWFSCAICDNRDGCLWVRHLEKTPVKDRGIKQIFGHTPTGPAIGCGGTLWNIDTPRKNTEHLPRAEAESWGGVAALVTKDNGITMELFYEA